MKYDRIRFVGASTVELPVDSSATSGPFILAGVEGLGPTEIEVNVAESIREGGTIKNVRHANRQITAQIMLAPAWNVGQSPDDLRETIYQLLYPRYGKLVKFQLFYGTVMQAEAQGRLSRCEPALNTPDPAVNITLDCDSPYFKPTTFDLQVPNKRIVGTETVFDVEYAGSAPTGFRVTFQLTAAKNAPLILSADDPAGGYIRVNGINWAAGDRLIVDTRVGSQSVFRARSATGYLTELILDSVEANPTWLPLYSGTNSFWLNVPGFNWVSGSDLMFLRHYTGV